MLGTLAIPVLLWYNQSLDNKEIMPSKNVLGTDNQQERLKLQGWICGFVDGEGCFSVSCIKNHTTKSRWQIFPEFVVAQGKSSLSSLKILQKYFECGNIFENRRKDNHRENLYRYCVRNRQDLEEKIIPFFKNNPLKTKKQKDFEYFCKILEMMAKSEHLTFSGMKKIAKIISKMNKQKPSRVLESSETIRRAPVL